MKLRQFLLALGCSLLAACAVQPADLPPASAQSSLDPAASGTAASAAEASTGEASTSAASSQLTTRCDDNACFEACTMTGACDGFCISNKCTCVGTQGPPCS
jgi:hypothetical protein